MVLRKPANRFWSVHDSRMRLKHVSLELTQKLLPLLLQSCASRKRVGNGLRWPDRQLRGESRNPLLVMAGRAFVEVRRVIQMAFQARQPISRFLSRAGFLRVRCHPARAGVLRQSRLSGRGAAV